MLLDDIDWTYVKKGSCPKYFMEYLEQDRPFVVSIHDDRKDKFHTGRYFITEMTFRNEDKPVKPVMHFLWNQLHWARLYKNDENHRVLGSGASSSTDSEEEAVNRLISAVDTYNMHHDTNLKVPIRRTDDFIQ